MRRTSKNSSFLWIGIVFVFAICCGSTGGAESSQSEDSTESDPIESIRSQLKKGQKNGSESFDHSGYDKLVGKHVDYEEGRVDYAGLSEDEESLEAYLQKVAGAELEKLAASAQLAFLLNAYNAYTLSLILEHYPDIESIKDLDKPWKTKRYEVAGQTLSLDQIEHELIRPVFKDPRIHFAVNCASIGCPPLASFAYKGSKIDKQLDKAARRALKDETWVRVEGGKLKVTKLMLWYKQDFTQDSYKKTEDTIPAFVAKYTTDEIESFIESKDGDPEIGYLDYNWKLNDIDK